MRIRVDATPEELGAKSSEMVKSIEALLRPVNPEMADALEKAIPYKEKELKFPVLRELQKRTETAYEKQMALMIKDIGKVLDKSMGKSLDDTNLEKAGPFIGPRGGKWADAAHTIPWKETKPRKMSFVFDVPSKELKRGEMSTVQPEAALVMSIILPQLRHNLADYAVVEVLKRKWQEEKKYNPSSEGVKDAKAKYIYAKKELTWVLPAKEIKQAIKIVSTLRTKKHVLEFADSKFGKRFMSDGLRVAVGMDKASDYSRPHIKEELEEYKKRIEKHKTLKDVSNRKRTAKDAEGIASKHGLGRVYIDDDLQPGLQKHLLTLVSNAFDDLSEVLGGLKIAHKKLVVAISSENTAFRPSYYYGAQYRYASSLDPSSWNVDFYDMDRQVNQPGKPPTLTLSMEYADAFAHEFGHAIDDAATYNREKSDEFVDARKALTEALLSSSMHERSVKKDEEKRGDSYYWRLTPEMFARGFEQYVAYKLASKGKVNTLLTKTYYDDKTHGGVFFEEKEFKNKMVPLYDRYIEAAKNTGVLSKAMEYAGLSPDYAQKIVDKEEKSYEQIKSELITMGYEPSDFDEGGPLFGYSTNQLIDLARDKRDD